MEDYCDTHTQNQLRGTRKFNFDIPLDGDIYANEMICCCIRINQNSDEINILFRNENGFLSLFQYKVPFCSKLKTTRDTNYEFN